MATELDELYGAKLLAVRAMGKKGPRSLFTAIFPFEFANPLGHNVLFTSMSYENNSFIRVSTRTQTNLYKGDSEDPPEGNLRVFTVDDQRIGKVSHSRIFCDGVIPKDLLIQYVDNSCVNVYRSSGESFGTHAATIVGNDANEVVVLKFMDIPMTVNEKLLVLFAMLRLFTYHFNFDKKPMGFFLNRDDERLRDNVIRQNQKKIRSADKFLLRPYGYANSQSKFIEIFADGGSLICVATWSVADAQFWQHIKNITGGIIYTSYSYDMDTSDGKIFGQNESLIGKVNDEIITMPNTKLPKMEVTRQKSVPVAYLIHFSEEEPVLAQIFGETANSVKLEFFDQLTQNARYCVMYLAIHYAITKFKIFDGVFPTIHHYPFISVD